LKTLVIKRSVVIQNRKTSISLEDAFWKDLNEIARGRETTLSQLLTFIDSNRVSGSRSSTLRLFVLEYFRARWATDTAPGNRAVNAASGQSDAVRPG
jgi:predicted DNA-binding ribbon-helix-helix protein